MNISQERLNEFKVLMKKHYGVKLTQEEAYESASRLLRFYELLLEIDQKTKKP